MFFIYENNYNGFFKFVHLYVHLLCIRYNL